MTMTVDRMVSGYPFQFTLNSIFKDGVTVGEMDISLLVISRDEFFDALSDAMGLIQYMRWWATIYEFYESPDDYVREFIHKLESSEDDHEREHREEAIFEELYQLSYYQWQLEQLDTDIDTEYLDYVIRSLDDYMEGKEPPFIFDRETQRQLLEQKYDEFEEDNTTSGYVYLIKHDADYKIGKANELDRRVKQISPIMPKPIECVCAIETDNPYELEKELHIKYADCRLNGEWFSLSDEMVQEIMRIANVPEEQLP